MTDENFATVIIVAVAVGILFLAIVWVMATKNRGSDRRRGRSSGGVDYHHCSGDDGSDD